MNYKYCKIKEVPVNLEQMKEILAYVKEYFNYSYSKPPTDKRIKAEVYIDDCPKNLKVTGRYINSVKLTTYIFSKDGREVELEPSVSDTYREIVKKTEDYHDLLKEDSYMDNFTSSPLLFSDYRYFYKPQEVICYDTNLTYFYLLGQDFPDTRQPKGKGVVRPREIGFRISGRVVQGNDGKQRSQLILVNPGDYADFRYPKRPSPFKRYINYKLEQLKLVKNKEERSKVKSSINKSVGNLQHHNPIWRAWIVESGNKRIKSLMDKNTIYANTDCVVSLIPRPDIPVSDKIGDFKIEHQGKCTIDGMTITWEDGTDNRRGAPKYPIIYRLNKENLELCLISQS